MKNIKNTISSLEIARITGRRHARIIQDIDKKDTITSNKMELTENDEMHYVLTRGQAMTLAIAYNSIHFSQNINNSDLTRIFKKEEKPHEGYMFMIYDGEHMKIGAGRNPKIIIGTILKHSGNKIANAVYFKVKDVFRVEIMIHKIYAKKRVTEDWFNLSEQDIKDCVGYLNYLECSNINTRAQPNIRTIAKEGLAAGMA
jgi:hypothetical protein